MCQCHRLCNWDLLTIWWSVWVWHKDSNSLRRASVICVCIDYFFPPLCEHELVHGYRETNYYLQKKKGKYIETNNDMSFPSLSDWKIWENLRTPFKAEVFVTKIRQWIRYKNCMSFLPQLNDSNVWIKSKTVNFT